MLAIFLLMSYFNGAAERLAVVSEKHLHSKKSSTLEECSNILNKSDCTMSVFQLLRLFIKAVLFMAKFME